MARRSMTPSTLLQLCRGKPCIEKRIQPVEGKMERVENEISRFIKAEASLRTKKSHVEAAYREAEQVTDSLELSSASWYIRLSIRYLFYHSLLFPFQRYRTRIST